jgi:putative membrane protein
MIPGAAGVVSVAETLPPTACPVPGEGHRAIPWHDARHGLATLVSDRPVRHRLGRVVSSAVLLTLGVTAALAPAAAAHGVDAFIPPTPSDILFDWNFDPLVSVPILLLAIGYLAAVRHVDRAHPGNLVPRARIVAFLGGLIAIEIALQSIIERYDTTLFSVHMVQHIMLTLVASPLLVLGAPVTLLLRVARPGIRHRFLLPILHSRVLRALSFPVVAWLLFAGVMWGTHFSPIFNESLDHPLIHQLEHVAYLTAGLLFWWPAVGLDPSPWRMPHPLRAMYLFLQMPQNTFLALAIYSASAPLYPHYAALILPWGPTALADQQMAGGLMWIFGDLVFIVSIVFAVVGWMRSEERDAAGRERREDAAVAAIRAREVALAERLARERAGEDTGSSRS